MPKLRQQSPIFDRQLAVCARTVGPGNPFNPGGETISYDCDNPSATIWAEKESLPVSEQLQQTSAGFIFRSISAMFTIRHEDRDKLPIDAQFVEDGVTWYVTGRQPIERPRNRYVQVFATSVNPAGLDSV